MLESTFIGTHLLLQEGTMARWFNRLGYGPAVIERLDLPQVARIRAGIGFNEQDTQIGFPAETLSSQHNPQQTAMQENTSFSLQQEYEESSISEQTAAVQEAVYSTDVETDLSVVQELSPENEESAASEDPPIGQADLAQWQDDAQHRSDQTKVSPMPEQIEIGYEPDNMKQTTSPLCLHVEVDVTHTLELLVLLNTYGHPHWKKIHLHDLLLKACALALEQFPDLNSTFINGQLVHSKSIDLGIITNARQNRQVLLIYEVNRKGVRSIAGETQIIEQKQYNMPLTEHPQTFFPVFYLDAEDMLDETELLYQPATALLACGSVQKRYLTLENQRVLRDITSLSLSVDHRAPVGTTATGFLQEIQDLLQNGYGLLG